LSRSEDLSAELAKMHECPLKQTSFSLTKGTWFTHKWWLASNVRNYAVIQGVMDILEKLGYQLKFADKDFIVMVSVVPPDLSAKTEISPSHNTLDLCSGSR
jgi:hypothetical protein